ncbi:MAG: hypothetical protein M3R51_10090 [Candidatus Eremiobacteraeota bacterium]|nr:hypothetical protein [Candidatus Eremiobacteraeota bacterium]
MDKVQAGLDEFVQFIRDLFDDDLPKGGLRAKQATMGFTAALSLAR